MGSVVEIVGGMERLRLNRPIMQIEISAVYCHLQAPCLLEATLAALAAQKVTDPLGWEIVVVGNNSQDETEG